MSKRKIGEIYNIPIVEGDPNLLKSNEILHKGGGQLSKRNNTGKIEDLGSSGSNNGSSGEGNVEYLALTTENPLYNKVYLATVEAKGSKIQDGALIGVVAPVMLFTGLGQNFGVKLTHIKVVWDKPVKMAQGSQVVEMSAIDTIIQMGVTKEEIDSIPRITEEEFYNLNL